MTAVAENYLIFLLALGRPLIESVVAEYDVVFLAVVLYAYDLFDDIAFRAVHIGCILDKIRYLTHGNSPLFITVKYFEKVFAKLLIQPLYVVVAIIPFVGESSLCIVLHIKRDIEVIQSRRRIFDRLIVAIDLFQNRT